MNFPLSAPMFTGLDTLRINLLWSENQVGHNEWQWEGTDRPFMYAKAKSGEFKTLYDENSFTYKVNSHFFRCPEFTDLDPTKPIFAVGGDSLTFGIGVPYEHTWAYIVWQKLKDEFPDTQYVNLAIGGTSIDFSTRVLSCFGDQVKHFDCYVNVLTEPARRELVLENCFIYQFMQYRMYDDFHHDREVNDAMKHYSKTFALDDYWTKYNLNRNLLMFDLMSKAYDVPMILDYWERSTSTSTFAMSITEEPFKKYFSVDFDKRFFAAPDPSIPEELLNGRDGVHPGKYYHERYAEIIYPLVREKFVHSLKTKRAYNE